MGHETVKPRSTDSGGTRHFSSCAIGGLRWFYLGFGCQESQGVPELQRWKGVSVGWTTRRGLRRREPRCWLSLTPPACFHRLCARERGIVVFFSSWGGINMGEKKNRTVGSPPSPQLAAEKLAFPGAG